MRRLKTQTTPGGLKRTKFPPKNLGGTASTKTDSQGHFKIAAPIGSKLRFTSVGYATKEVTVTSNTVNVTIESSNEALEEVVVVGYGTQKKGNVPWIEEIAPRILIFGSAPTSPLGIVTLNPGVVP